MAGTYGEAQKKYYEKNKDKIYRKVRKYKLDYNREYYWKNRERILREAVEKRALKRRQNVYNAVKAVSGQA